MAVGAALSPSSVLIGSLGLAVPAYASIEVEPNDYEGL